MSGAESKNPVNDKLETLLASIASSFATTLSSLVGRETSAGGGALAQTEVARLLEAIDEEQAVIVGALDDDFAGQIVRFMVSSADASTLAGHMLMSPDPDIEERRKTGKLEGEDLATFAEVANVLCSGVDQLLRDSVEGDVALRPQDSGVVSADGDEDKRLGEGELLEFKFPFSIEGYPDSEATILLEPETAERWNGGPVDSGGGQGSAGGETAAGTADQAGESPSLPEDALEDIPEAEPRGRLATFLMDQECLASIRKSCRRVGLELEQHARTDIPNPAAHGGAIVLIEVPPADSKRFEWCKRLKTYRHDIRVVLLLRRPTRAQVVAGFMAKADAILGEPMVESQLSERLGPMLDPSEPE